MALRGAFPVDFVRAFPDGAYATSEVEPMFKFVNGKPTEQETDEHGRLLWSVTVHDADKDVKGTGKSLKVKLASDAEPVAPTPKDGSPFAPVEFDGLTATAYLIEPMKGRFKVAYSYRATGLRAPRPGMNSTGSNSSSNSTSTSSSSAASSGSQNSSSNSSSSKASA